MRVKDGLQILTEPPDEQIGLAGHKAVAQVDVKIVFGRLSPSALYSGHGHRGRCDGEPAEIAGSSLGGEPQKSS